jgi:hypothetical protein
MWLLDDTDQSISTTHVIQCQLDKSTFEFGVRRQSVFHFRKLRCAIFLVVWPFERQDLETIKTSDAHILDFSQSLGQQAVLTPRRRTMKLQAFKLYVHIHLSYRFQPDRNYLCEFCTWRSEQLNRETKLNEGWIGKPLLVFNSECFAAAFDYQFPASDKTELNNTTHHPI